MDYLRVKNWEEFQHYRDRLPPWIKLHRALLTDYEFCHLPDETKCHLVMAWLLASQMDGRLPDDARWIAARIGANKPVNLDLLIRGGWLIRERSASKDASATIAPRKHSAIVETETYKATEAEAEKPSAQAREELPAWVPKETWSDFVAYRRKQKGWTTKAESLLLRELDKLRGQGNDPVGVIEQSIANGWKGLFPLRSGVMNGKARHDERSEQRAETLNGLTGGLAVRRSGQVIDADH